MTLTFLDLYNTAASQEWSMYDNDATNKNEFEKSLVIDLNKAVSEILYSYPFSFRQRTHVLFTIPGINGYATPKGLIQRNSIGDYCVRINSKPLILIEDNYNLDDKKGVPEGFYIKGSKLFLYPIPSERFIVTTDYLTLALGEDKNGEDIYTLKNDDDVLSVPEYLEEIFKTAVISRTMLSAISSEKDENYSAYKKQSETAYRQLVKYSKGVCQEKFIKI